jgi:hypothetical protein
MTHLRSHQNTKLGVFGTGYRPHAYLAPEIVYEVVALIPREDNVTENIYRIKSKVEAMVRVARESQLKARDENRTKGKEPVELTGPGRALFRTNTGR